MFQTKLLAEGGIVSYDPEFLSKELADKYFEHLKEKVLWERKEYVNYRTGNKIFQPRLTAWFADESHMAYSYSGVTQLVQEWTPELLEIKKLVEDVGGATYNSVLLNLYRDGADSVGMHADDEPELGTNATIASLSLGATRKFLLSQYKSTTDSYDEEEYDLVHGSLLIMAGTTQHFWKHSIPKADFSVRDSIGPRINLTFRTFKKA